MKRAVKLSEINAGDRVKHRTPGFTGTVRDVYGSWLWVLWDGERRPKSCRIGDISEYWIP